VQGEPLPSATPQTLATQLPPRHVTGVVHALPSGSPHLPSALHAPLRHCAARVQGAPPGWAPFAAAGAHVVATVSQYSPLGHCASAVQVAVHVPSTHAPSRQAVLAEHACPRGSPHRTSV
jgi:hypothetical protein